jgi:hypothetical protein
MCLTILEILRQTRLDLFSLELDCGLDKTCGLSFLVLVNYTLTYTSDLEVFTILENPETNKIRQLSLFELDWVLIKTCCSSFLVLETIEVSLLKELEGF